MIVEIENLKKLFFSKEQLVLLNLISKPQLRPNTELKEDHESEEFDIFNSDTLKAAYEYIEKLSLNPLRMTPLDEKLISSLDLDMTLAFAEGLGLNQ